MKRLFLILILPSVCFAAGDLTIRQGAGGGNIVIQSGTGGGGGSTSPGGSNTNVQFSSNSTFGGDNGFQYDSSVSSVTIGGAIKATKGSTSFIYDDKGKFGSSSGDPTITLDDESGTPGSGFRFLYSGVMDSFWTDGTSEWSLGVSTANSTEAVSRIALSKSGSKIIFRDPNSTEKVSFDTLGNSTFSTPVVLATLLSASSLATDSTGKIIAGTGGSGGSTIYSATSTTGSPFGASFSTITVNQTLTGNTTAMTIISTGTGNALLIIGNGIPAAGAQSKQGGVVNIVRNALSDGLVIYSSVTSAQAGTTMLALTNDNTGYNDPIMWIHNNGNSSNPFLRVDDQAPDLELVNTSTDNANGLGKWEPMAIAYQGVGLQINSRARNNGTFENVATWTPLQNGGGLTLSNVVNGQDGNLSTSNTQPIVWVGTNSSSVGLQGPKAPNGSWNFILPPRFANGGQVLYQTSDNPRQWDFTTGGVAGQSLKFNSSSSAPTWSLVSLSTEVTSQLATTSIAAGTLPSNVLVSSLPASGVTAGSYTNTNLTVDAQGRISSASNGSAGGGSASGVGGSVQISSGGALSSVSGLVFSTATNTLFAPGPIVSSGTTTGMSTISRGLTVNASGFATQDSSLIVEQSGGAYALNFNPATNVFTSSVAFTASSSSTFNGPMLGSNGAGSTDQVWSSSGTALPPYWRTVTLGGGSGDMILASTQTSSGAKTWSSYSNFNGSATFASTVLATTETITGQLLMPTKASGSPSLARSADTTTGIGFGSTEVDIDISGAQALQVLNGSETFNGTSTIADGTITSTSTVDFTIRTSGSDAGYYVRQLDTHQNAASRIRGVSYGLRDNNGEDPFFFVTGYDQATGSFPTDYFHINASSTSSSAGFVGIGVSTPTNNLTIKGTEGVFYTAASTPSVTTCGTSTVYGNDISGKVVLSGVLGSSCQINFNSVHISSPSCQFSLGFTTASGYPSTTTTPTSFKVTLAGADTFSGSWDYRCTDVRFQ